MGAEERVAGAVVEQSQMILAGADVACLLFLVFVVFVPRFHRRDVAVALCTLNLGVLSISMLLTNSEVSAGLGLGLFGLLSIVRLRSDEMTHEEMSFYFCALILGMIGGIATEPLWMPLAAMGALVVTVFAVGHPRLLSDVQVRTIVLDRAVARSVEIRDRLDTVIDGRVLTLRVLRVDLINDSTTVQVRYRENEPPVERPSLPASPTIDLRDHDRQSASPTLQPPPVPQ